VRRVFDNGLWLAAMGAALVLVGCGSSSAPVASGHAGFVSQANGICKAANTQIHGLPAPVGAEAVAAASLLGEELPVATAELHHLERLAPTGPERVPFAAYLATAVQEIAIASNAHAAAQADNLASFHEAITQLAAVTIKSNTAATSAGLLECTSKPEAAGSR